MLQRVLLIWFCRTLHFSCLNYRTVLPPQVISSSVNYYNWDSSADLITSRVLTIDLMGELGEVLTVQNLTTDIQLGIQVDERSANNDSNTTETLYVKPERSQYHKLQVIREGTSYLVTITANDSLHVLVKYGSKPSVEDHDKNYTVPDFTSCTKNVTATDEEDEYNCTRNPHQLLLTNEVIKKPGVYYLGILYSRNSSSGSHSHRTRRSCFTTNRQKRSCVETKDPPPPLGVYEDGTIPSYDPRVDLNYTIETDELGCRFWSHYKEKWLTEGCKVLTLLYMKKLRLNRQSCHIYFTYQLLHFCIFSTEVPIAIK